jgi:hypothetical protein
VKDVRPHRIATLFGEVRARLPRFLCYGCDRRDTGVSWPSHCRSTLELDQLQARLSALMPYRVAADMLVHLLPIDTRKSPETLRSHTLRAGEQFGDAAVDQRTAATAAITVSLCSTFIRSREDGTRHMEFRVGNVEATAGERQVFAAVAKADTDIVALILRNLETAGQTEAAEVTAFTDGCPGLRSILADAGGHEATNSRLVPHCHADAARNAGRQWIIDRQPRSGEGKGGDRRGSRAPALAHLER